MEPGPPDSKRQRIASWSSLPRPHINTSSHLPPPRAPPAQHPSPYPPYPARPAESHSGSSTPVHPTTPAQQYPDSDRRHHEPETYAPMQEHYQHHPPPQHHHPASPAHAPYHPYPPRDPSSVKREPPVEDRRPSSTGHAPDAPPSQASHHPLPPPPNYPDGQPRHMSYDNAHSVPPTPGGYRGPNYQPPPPTPIPQQQPPYEPHASYPAEPPFFNVSYSNLPSKKKNTRASQACDQCRQLKAKCDETKPCKTCRDKGLECKYRDPVPKATDKAQADILDALQLVQSTVTDIASQFGAINDRMTRLENGMGRDGINGQNRPLPILKTDQTGDEEMKPAQQSPMLANGISDEAYYPPDASREMMPSSDQLAPRQMMAAEDAEEAEPGPPVPPGEPAIPINHTTLAGLLLEWPSIRELTKHHLEREGIRYPSEFPVSQEQSRGPLIVYGRGEASQSSRRSKEPTDHGNVDMTDDSSDAAASPSPAADFGSLGGLSPPDAIEYKGGVLAVDGHPDFSEMKVWSYVQSFKDHILNMHPIVQPNVLEYWVRHFLDTLPTTHPRSAKVQPAKPTFAVAPTSQSQPENSGSKRKRSMEPEGSDGPPTPSPAKSGRPNRSIHSALVLTVLALGKICQYRDRIPDVVQTNGEFVHSGSPVMRNGVPGSPSHSSPPSHSYPSAQPSPFDQGERGSQSRRPSIHGYSGARSGYHLKKNYEVIPGLEYFAYATDILGNMAGAYNDIKDVYANIFASLYYGQLNRPLESFAFIHKASHKLQVIMRPSLDKLRTLKRNAQFINEDKYNQLALAFWTCLQLESDLIAELPLPPSGLLSYEDDMPHPNMSLLHGFDQRILDSYPGQLYLRTHLNSIHRMFYAPEDPNKPGQDKFKNVKLVADAVSTMHWVAPSLTFKEDDAPGPDILSARLRAKYWGAQVITYRPFIRQILQFSNSIKNHPSSPNPPIRTEFRDDVIAPVISQGATSLSDIDDAVVQLASRGIKALIESTRAFHKLGGERPIITNVFGTAHAQWGNLLVLSAAFRDPVLSKYVEEDLLHNLFQRTIKFFEQSATATSSLRIDMRILEGLQHDLFPLPDPRTGSSFSSHTSLQTPKMTAATTPMLRTNSIGDAKVGPPQPLNPATSHP